MLKSKPLRVWSYLEIESLQVSLIKMKPHWYRMDLYAYSICLVYWLKKYTMWRETDTCREKTIWRQKKQAFLVVQGWRLHLPMQKTLAAWAWPLGQGDPQEKRMATRSSVLAWETPWTEEPGGLQSTGLQRVGRNEWLSTTTLEPLTPI